MPRGLRVNAPSSLRRDIAGRGNVPTQAIVPATAGKASGSMHVLHEHTASSMCPFVPLRRNRETYVFKSTGSTPRWRRFANGTSKQGLTFCKESPSYFATRLRCAEQHRLTKHREPDAGVARANLKEASEKPASKFFGEILLLHSNARERRTLAHSPSQKSTG